MMIRRGHQELMKILCLQVVVVKWQLHVLQAHEDRITTMLSMEDLVEIAKKEMGYTTSEVMKASVVVLRKKIQENRRSQQRLAQFHLPKFLTI